MCCDPRFDQIWPKKWKNRAEKWVGLHEKIVIWLQNFGHGLSSSYYMIYVLRSKIRPDLTKKVKKLIRKMSGARWKNGPMTPKLCPWPILIILHDICVAIKNSFFSGAFKTRQVNTVSLCPMVLKGIFLGKWLYICNANLMLTLQFCHLMVLI